MSSPSVPRMITSPEMSAKELRANLPEAVSPFFSPVRYVEDYDGFKLTQKHHEGSKFDVTCYSDATVILPLKTVEKIMEELEPVIDRMFKISFHEMDAKDLPGHKKWNMNMFHMPITLRHITKFLHGTNRFACFLLFNVHASWNHDVLTAIFDECHADISKVECTETKFNTSLYKLTRKFNEWYLSYPDKAARLNLPFDINLVPDANGKKHVAVPFEGEFLKRYAIMHVLRMIGILVRDAKKKVDPELQQQFAGSIHPTDYMCVSMEELLDAGVDGANLLWLGEFVTHICNELGGTFHYFEMFDNNAVSFQALKGMLPLTPENFTACFKFNTDFFSRFVNNNLDSAKRRADRIQDETEYQIRKARKQLRAWKFSPEEMDQMLDARIVPKLKAQFAHLKPCEGSYFTNPQIGFTKKQLLEAIVQRSEEMGTYLDLPAYKEHLPTLAVMGGAFAEGTAATLGIPGLTNRLERHTDRFREGIKYNGSKYALMCIYWAMNKCYQFEDWKKLVNEDNYVEIHTLMRALGFSVPQDPATLDLEDVFTKLQITDKDEQ